MVAATRLADLLASISLLGDLSFSLPAEETMRTTILATGLARRSGLPEAQVAEVFYVALLQHLGCTGFAHETSQVYGDELVVNAAAGRMGDDTREVLDVWIRETTRGRGPVDFARVTLFTLTRGAVFGRRFATARCEVGRETARRLGLGEGVRRGLFEVAESWDGRGGVQGLRGEAISLPARIASLAAIAARFDDLGGRAAVVAVLRRRAGRSLDPALVATFVGHADDLLHEAHDGDPRDRMLACEPGPHRLIQPAALAGVAEAIGDVADLKSTFTLGDARGVAQLAARAARSLGQDEAGIARTRIGASLHDVGRVGISDRIWERPGPLTAAEWEQVRLHAYHGERILDRSEALRPWARIVGLHHERLDGSGYHRGATGRDLPGDARLLAAADAFHALTEPRPHRPARSADEAASQLADEAAAGRLDRQMVDAVVTAAGVPARPAPPEHLPAGLTAREAVVLGLLARGLSNRAIGQRLAVSPRTAEHHVQHIYAKLGVSSRAAAALFAMEHDLLDRREDG